jgi:MurNAc alpha-1-phosphate uridylyltransferase
VTIGDYRSNGNEQEDISVNKNPTNSGDKPGIKNAIILAAGLGTRMRPITDAIPKPLVKVAGKTLLDYSLDSLHRQGIEKVVVNVHYLGEQIKSHLANYDRAQIMISDESEKLLDSGGGIKNALKHFGGEPFFVLNSDSFWLEGSIDNLALLHQVWDNSKMDILLLLSPLNTAVGFGGNGDFDMMADGILRRRTERKIAAFAYAGAAIVHPRLFADTPDGPFSLNLLFDRAIGAGRLHGCRMNGLWLHVGTPEAIGEAEIAIARSAA